MTQIIVPLAGPDAYDPDIKALREIDGQPMISRVLGQRSWIEHFDEAEDQLTFVMRSNDGPAHELEQALRTLFPISSIVHLPELTAGASFSALAGLSQNRQPDAPVIIDLVDIEFSWQENHTQYFAQHPRVMALVPYFLVNNDTPSQEKYSYLELDGVNVIRTREKEIISTTASAGVYLFRNVATYLEAMRYALANRGISTVGGVYFVCPMVNGLTGAGNEVHGLPVEEARSYSV